MVVRVLSAAPFGIEAIPVEVEVHLRSGLPGFAVVGLPQAAVRESRDRVLAAIRNSDLPIPRGAVTVNLAPADVRKTGTLFDLPLAIALLAVQERLPRGVMLNSIVIVGELALDGRIRPGRGILAIAQAARTQGFGMIMVPSECAAEAGMVEGMQVAGVSTLAEAVQVITSGTIPPLVQAPSKTHRHERPGLDLSDVRGQPMARRALEIAAAGSHSMLLVGPPGVGKSMLARRLPGILPRLSTDHALEVMQIQSVAGRLGGVERLVERPPFEAPHHSVSRAGLIGGGNPPRPGALSLAHRGVLFLDELPEYQRSTLEALREPLESGFLMLSRARYQVRFPSACQLVAAMNPCPCGFAGHSLRPCVCDPGSLTRYAARVSGPLLDRIDLHVPVGSLEPGELFRDGEAESSEKILDRVNGARSYAQKGSLCKRLDAPGIRLLERAMVRYGISARAVERLRRIARTIANLAHASEIKSDHVAEALHYHRPRYRQVA